MTATEDAMVVALAYRYPAPGSLETLESAVGGLDGGPVRRNLERFLDRIKTLTLGHWEELHTFTLDLSPLFIPYVGHVEWGENYRRGEFMAALNRDMADQEIDLRGELPDHVEPVLRYLATASEPLADLTEVVARAVRQMGTALDQAAEDNPYRHVIAATVAAIDAIAPGPSVTVSIGGRR